MGDPSRGYESCISYLDNDSIFLSSLDKNSIFSESIEFRVTIAW